MVGQKHTQNDITFFFIQVHFISHGGVTCQVAVHKSVHDLVRCATARNFTAIVNILWGNSLARPEILKVVRRAVANEFAGLCSTKDNSAFRCADDNNLQAAFVKQREESKLKAPVMWEIISGASINERAMRRNKIKTPESIMPALMTAFGLLLSIRNRNMNQNMAINEIHSE